jgi:AcrR family transcriptional regulator
VDAPISERTAEATDMARHIARAAARLFAERGYDATPVREIVKAAGVTKPTLYYYFGSKDGLAHALLTAPLGRLEANLKSIIEGPGDPVRKLEQVTEAQFEFCREDPDRARFVYALFFGPLGSELSAELAQFGEACAAINFGAVDAAAHAGLIDPSRAESFARALRGLIVVHTMDFLYRERPLGADLAGRIVSDLLRGFGVQESPGVEQAAARSEGRGETQN